MEVIFDGMGVESETLSREDLMRLAINGAAHRRLSQYNPITGQPVSTPTEAEINDYAWKVVRQMIQQRLSETDWVELSNSPVSADCRYAFRAYRQALRDIPEYTTDPAKIIFPEVPLIEKVKDDPVVHKERVKKSQQEVDKLRPDKDLYFLLTCNKQEFKAWFETVELYEVLWIAINAIRYLIAAKDRVSAWLNH